MLQPDPLSLAAPRFATGRSPGGGEIPDARDGPRSSFLFLLTFLLPLSLLAGCGGDRGDEAGSEGRGGPEPGPHRQVVRPPGSSGSSLFSPAVRSGRLLFLSGTLGYDSEAGRLAEGGVGPETRQAMENVRQRLRAAGASMDDLLKCTVFLAEMDDYGAMNEVYREFFEAEPPARSAVAVSGLALDARVEIECIAAVPEGAG